MAMALMELLCQFPMKILTPDFTENGLAVAGQDHTEPTYTYKQALLTDR